MPPPWGASALRGATDVVVTVFPSPATVPGPVGSAPGRATVLAAQPGGVVQTTQGGRLSTPCQRSQRSVESRDGVLRARSVAIRSRADWWGVPPDPGVLRPCP